MRKNLLAWSAAVGLSAALVAGGLQAASAHHAVQAQFDVETTLTAKAKLTRIQLVNPHPQLYFDFPDRAGQITNWRIEAPAIAALRRMGILRILKVGETYTVDYAPARNGEPNALFRGLETSDGRRFASEVSDPSRPPE